ncbi:DegT/DnrJ/EryC1/StrS family aminotransferase [Methanobrevibacter oralis]|uniref:DegT/DnrJ/EryC1/StrS aminotransferase family protein n=2 Tax=Methanobrevibacter oralis TaxID=66851 RepID=A0A166AEH5_METOA|nr:DegT/DnrJ/EryC1/StrS family aminotransferase [Methanobrevibacter oralis]KZX11931.1 DegT/DnrJ/EryC1/StrS aminotransferase family protein [Methanobrevibacter oralis]
MFKFKTTPQETKKVMSKVASGEIKDINFEDKCKNKISLLTGHEFSKITSSGNNSIFIALSAIDGPVIIPDQGGWHGFKQIAKFLNKKILTLKTDLGLINTSYLDELDIEKNSALIFTSFAAYSAEQDVKSISKYCKNNGIISIEDASAGIGDKQHKLGCGNYSDIIVSSTGSPKMINAGSGGFISTNNEEFFDKTKLPQKLSKTNEIICAGIHNELNNVADKLELTLNANSYVKKHVVNSIYENKRGINTIILNGKYKEISWKLKKLLPIDKSGFITKCPNYNRVKSKGLCIEIKNLDYNCLEKEYLDKIIEAVNNLQQA